MLFFVRIFKLDSQRRNAKTQQLSDQLSRKLLSPKAIKKYSKSVHQGETHANITINEYLPLFHGFAKEYNILLTKSLMNEIESQKYLTLDSLATGNIIIEDNVQESQQPPPLLKKDSRPQLRSSHSHNQITIKRTKGKNDQHQRKVFVLYTGGTMGMRCDDSGSLKPDPGYLTEQIFNMPELQSSTMPTITIIEYDFDLCNY